MNLYNRIKKIFSGSFIQDVAKLSLGTLAGRLVTLAALPMSTRIYSPDDFSLLATFLAFVSLIAVSSCLRYEISIPMADDEQEAFEILIISFITLALVVLITTVIMLVIPNVISKKLGSTTINNYLWLVPISVALSGGYSIIQYWATREKKFDDIARTRVTQAVSGVVATVTFGWLGFIPVGLLIGNILNSCAGSVSLGMRTLKEKKYLLKLVNYKRLIETFIKNKNYPIYSAPEALFNIAGIQVSILLIARHEGAEAGYLIIAMQLMAIPMGLLGSSISQVYISRAPAKYKDGDLGEFTYSIMKRLAMVGVPPILLAGITAPFIFPYILGEEWVRAGEMVMLMVPWMILQFIASPVSMVMYVVERSRGMLILTTIGMILRLGFIIAGVHFKYSLIESFAVASAIFYAICITIFLSFSYSKGAK